jgi:hypothetical protein
VFFVNLFEIGYRNATCSRLALQSPDGTEFAGGAGNVERVRVGRCRHALAAVLSHFLSIFYAYELLEKVKRGSCRSRRVSSSARLRPPPLSLV